ncbi:MAG: hypothetical protein HY293_10060 [Planctomycetes bacterium]|nr:hypothetical protein [Planctomycetota bacterium]
MSPPFFNLPLNLPHAATIVHRILHHMRGRGAPAEALARVGGLLLLLEPWRDQEENGPAEAAEKIRQSAAALGRLVVDDIEKCGVGYDRLGQAIRNLFECLAMGEEGAQLSLRAGENPRSTMRPI